MPARTRPSASTNSTREQRLSSGGLVVISTVLRSVSPGRGTEPAETLGHGVLRHRVHGRGRVVQNQDRAVRQQRARHGQPLPLPTGQVLSVVGETAVESIGEVADGRRVHGRRDPVIARSCRR